MSEGRAIRVRIVGGPHSAMTRLIDVETGAELKGVVAFSINHEAGGLANGEAMLGATLVLLTDVEFNVEVLATARRFGVEPHK